MSGKGNLMVQGYGQYRGLGCNIMASNDGRERCLLYGKTLKKNVVMLFNQKQVELTYVMEGEIHVRSPCCMFKGILE